MTLHDQRDRAWPGVAIGLMILGLGIILLLDQVSLFGWQPSLRIWPFLIIALGLARFAQPRDDGSRDGGWLIFFGVWLLLHEMRILRFRDSWPLILVVLGIAKMWKALRPARDSRQHGQPS